MVSNRKEKYWQKSLEISQLAVTSNSLQQLSTECHKLLFGNDLFYEYRKIKSTNFKLSSVIGPKLNPFLPWDRNLQIDMIGNDHVLILNKFPVQTGHMLLITSSWKPQDGWLDSSDFKSLLSIELDTSGLWFFNSGPKAGASQTHRHLQLLRRTDLEMICPFESWYKEPATSTFSESSLLSKNIFVSTRNNDRECDLYLNYLELTSMAGLGSPKSFFKPLFPYNLLISPSWIVLIRRSKEFAHGYGLNALAFAGYFLETAHSDEVWFKENGPISLLEDVVDNNLF